MARTVGDASRQVGQGGCRGPVVTRDGVGPYEPLDLGVERGPDPRAALGIEFATMAEHAGAGIDPTAEVGPVLLRFEPTLALVDIEAACEMATVSLEPLGCHARCHIDERLGVIEEGFTAFVGERLCRPTKCIDMVGPDPAGPECRLEDGRGLEGLGALHGLVGSSPTHPLLITHGVRTTCALAGIGEKVRASHQRDFEHIEMASQSPNRCQAGFDLGDGA